MTTKDSSNPFGTILTYAALIMAVAALVLSSFSWIKTNKVAYVNSQTLIQKYKGAVTAREKLEKESEEWKKNIKTLEDELTVLNKEVMESNNKWSPAVRKQKLTVFEQKQMEYNKYSRAVQEKASKREKELIQPVFDELNVYVKDYGAENGYTIIFGTVAGGNILYGEDAADITEPFLTFANAK